MRIHIAVMLLITVIWLDICCAMIGISPFSHPKLNNGSIQLHPPSQVIVLVGHKSVINITCMSRDTSEHRNTTTLMINLHSKAPLMHLHPRQFICNATIEPPLSQEIEIFGLYPGETILVVDIQDLSKDQTYLYSGRDKYSIIVVERSSVANDAFMYVISMVNFLALLILAFRMRTDAVKRVFLQPCSLINAIICQMLLLPLVSKSIFLCFHLVY